MSFTLKVHEYGKIPNSPFMKIVRARHYLRISSDGNAPIYLQDGKFWSEGGQPLAADTLPGWFWEQVDKVSDEALRSVRFDRKTMRINTKEPIAQRRRGRRPKQAAVTEETEHGND